MKLLATTETGYMVDMSRIEMAHLLGHLTYTEQNKDRVLHIGDEVEIDKMFKQLKFYASIHDQLAKAAIELDNMAKNLVLLDPISKPVSEHVE